jgi:hypothetical protein
MIRESTVAAEADRHAFDRFAVTLLEFPRGDSLKHDREAWIMATLELTVTLPETVAKEAQAIGLLQPEALERLFREAIRRRQQEQLFADADRLAALDLPPLLATEVNAEIEAARKERRADRARRG